MKSKSQLLQFGVPLAWRQLTLQKRRTFVALCGVGFALFIMLFQMGFYDIFRKLTWTQIGAMDGDLAIVAKGSTDFMNTTPFSERRLFQVNALEEVADVYPVMISRSNWHNPENGKLGTIVFLGINPAKNPFKQQDVRDNLHVLSTPDGVLYDKFTPVVYGNVKQVFAKEGVVWAEINKERVCVKGLFSMGASLSSMCNILANNATFSRVTGCSPDFINLGLIKLKEGVDPLSTANKLKTMLPDDVIIFTKSELIDWQINYWDRSLPVGSMVLMGVVMAIVVGSIVIYQVLFTDINDHIKEFATLKALGLDNTYLVKIVLHESIILLGASFFPAIWFCQFCYYLGNKLFNIPASVTVESAIIALLNGAVMCVIASYFATKKLRETDPVEIF